MPSKKVVFNKILYQLLIIFVLCSANLRLYSQYSEKKYFIAPLKGGNIVTNNFGQIRANHFHAGVDIKTSSIGVPVVAVADGYVSRVKVSSVGYGNALYVTHPNGFKTVYAHLDRFADDISLYAEFVQKEEGKSEITFYTDSSMFKVQQGQIIGYSGSSGRSTGPHLHYEIRKSLRDIPVNPELYGLKVKDNIAPQVKNLIIYPLDQNSLINGQNSKTIIPLSCSNGNCFSEKTLSISGKVGFASDAYDLIESTRRAQAVYSVQLLFDNKEIFRYKNDAVSFEETRAINSFIDYYSKKRYRKNYQKYYIEPGNKLGIYGSLSNNGIIEFNDDKIHKIEIKLSDINSNECIIKLNVKSARLNVFHEKHKPVIYQDSDYFFVKPDFRMIIPAHSLFTDIKKLDFAQYQSSQYYSDIFQVHNEYTPLFTKILISIRANSVPVELIDKAIIVEIDQRGRLYPLETHYINGFLSAQTISFGKYAITIDDTPPEIVPLSNFSKPDLYTIEFKVSDNLSGIQNIFSTIDDKFVVFYYDQKSDIISCKLDKTLKTNSEHNLFIEICDKKNNKAVFKTVFFK